MLIDWVAEPQKKNRQIFKNTILYTICTIFRKLHYVKLEAILKGLQGSVEEEDGEL